MNFLAIFCAKQLVFIETLLGLALVVRALPLRRHLVRRRWLICILMVLGISAILSLVLGHFIHDPRPFVADGSQPLIPHEPNNGFPSHHALLAAVMVASVALLDARLAIPIALLALAVEWGRVACHIHHVGDVLGSDLIVLAATVVGVWCARHVREVRTE